MSSEMHVLDKQLELLESQSSGERWLRDHAEAMVCRDAEDLIALALETLERIRKRQAELGPEAGLAYFRRWHATSLKALDRMEWLEAGGYALENSDAFRFAINEASIAVDADQVARAGERLRTGKWIPLQEIEDEL